MRGTACNLVGSKWTMSCVAYLGPSSSSLLSLLSELELELELLSVSLSISWCIGVDGWKMQQMLDFFLPEYSLISTVSSVHVTRGGGRPPSAASAEGCCRSRSTGVTSGAIVSVTVVEEEACIFLRWPHTGGF